VAWPPSLSGDRAPEKLELDRPFLEIALILDTPVEFYLELVAVVGAHLPDSERRNSLSSVTEK
jgi:hypothetical protein